MRNRLEPVAVLGCMLETRDKLLGQHQLGSEWTTSSSLTVRSSGSCLATLILFLMMARPRPLLSFLDRGGYRYLAKRPQLPSLRSLMERQEYGP